MAQILNIADEMRQNQNAYLRHQLMQQEIEQNRIRNPMENSLFKAHLEEMQRRQQEDAQTRQAAQQATAAGAQYDAQGAAMGSPALSKPDEFGTMQTPEMPIGQGPRPDNATIAVAKKWVSQGQPDKAMKLIEPVLKAAEVAGDVEGAVNTLNTVFNTKYKADPLKGTIFNISDGSVLARFNPKTGTATTLLENPKDATGKTANWEVEQEQKWLDQNPGKTHLDYVEEKANRTRADARTPTSPWIEQFKAEKGRPPTIAEMDAHDKSLRTAGMTLQMNNMDLSDEALSMAASVYLKTGQLPAMGMGAASARSKILQRAAELGKGQDVASNMATFAADKGSLTNIQKSRDAITSFEQTAYKNADLMLELAQKLTDTNSPWLNRPIRAIQASGGGDTNVRNFEAARRVFANEVAKITSNPNMVGILSDEARKEIDQILSPDSTIPQIAGLVKTLKRDMANRRSSLDFTIKEIKSRIGGQGSMSSPAGSAAPKVGDQKKFPNGKIGVWDGQGWVAQ